MLLRGNLIFCFLKVKYGTKALERGFLLRLSWTNEFPLPLLEENVFYLTFTFPEAPGEWLEK